MLASGGEVMYRDLDIYESKILELLKESDYHWRRCLALMNKIILLDLAEESEDVRLSLIHI